MTAENRNGGINNEENPVFYPCRGYASCARRVRRSGTLHIAGDLAMERGSIVVSGGTLRVDGSVWLGADSVTVSGGELVVPGGADAVALDAGTLSVTGGTVREP